MFSERHREGTKHFFADRACRLKNERPLKKSLKLNDPRDESSHDKIIKNEVI